jgi:hypothetical protein
MEIGKNPRTLRSPNPHKEAAKQASAERRGRTARNWRVKSRAGQRRDSKITFSSSGSSQNSELAVTNSRHLTMSSVCRQFGNCDCLKPNQTRSQYLTNRTRDL